MLSWYGSEVKVNYKLKCAHHYRGNYSAPGLMWHPAEPSIHNQSNNYLHKYAQMSVPKHSNQERRLSQHSLAWCAEVNVYYGPILQSGKYWPLTRITNI